MNWGGFGLSVSTETLAKFGQLYLQKGVWKGKQILTEDWINQSSAKQVSNGSDPLGHWDQGYGFQFWRNQKHGYRADGAFGQFCFIYPEFDMVLAMTSGTGDTKGVMDLVSEQLLPALVNEKLAENPVANATLNNKLKTLKLPTASGSSVTPLARKFSGKTYQLSENGLGLKSVNFSFNQKGNAIAFTTNTGTEKILTQKSKWLTSETLINSTISYSGNEKLKIATSGSWLNDNTFALLIAYLETETILKLTFKFDGDKVSIQGERNVNFGPTKLPEIIGMAK